jgi:hypothetical protein
MRGLRMTNLLTTDWQPLFQQFLTLWLIGWGLRAGLVVLLLGGLYWFWQRK